MTVSDSPGFSPRRLAPLRARMTWALNPARVPLIIAVAILLGLFFFPGLFAPHDPLAVSLGDRLRPPVWHAEGTWEFPFGTDPVGRDILSRIIYGARISITIAGAALLLGGGVGSILGVVAGYKGGRTDALLMRLVDMSLAIPMILLALLLAATFGNHSWVVVSAVSLVVWARFARVIRGEVLSLRERDYVLMAKVAGGSSFRIISRHMLPNVINTIVVVCSLQLGWAIIVEASLSFLGAGVPPPQPAWGSMTAIGREHIVGAYWVPLLPGLAILITVLTFNVIGDRIRDRIDPRLVQI